jgi:hypothetical protein
MPGPKPRKRALATTLTKDRKWSSKEKQESEDASMKAAGKIARLGGRQLSHEQKKKLGLAVHYSFGTLQGGVYRGVCESTGVRGGLLPGLIVHVLCRAAATPRRCTSPGSPHWQPASTGV